MSIGKPFYTKTPEHCPEFYSNPSGIHFIESLMYSYSKFWRMSDVYLCRNPAARHILIKNSYKNKISDCGYCWFELCSRNPCVIDHLEQHLDCVNWVQLSSNPAAIHILKQNNGSIIHWDRLSNNENAIELLMENIDKINWYLFNLNPNPLAVEYLEQHPEKIIWQSLSANPAAIHLLEANPEKIDWAYLSANPAAIHLLEANPEKTIYKFLAVNPNAMHLLLLLDTKKMNKNMKPFAEELMSYVFNPMRLSRMSERLGVDLEDLLDMY